MKNLARFAISAVIVAAVMFLCITTYNNIQPQDSATYTDSAEVQGEVVSSTNDTTTTAAATTTTTAASTTTATTTTAAAKQNKNSSQKSSSAKTAAATTTAATTTAAPASPQTQPADPPASDTTAETSATVTETTATTQNTSSMSAGQYASAMFEKVNSYRTQNGRSSLSRVTSGPLYEAAKLRLSEIMVSFSHTRPNGAKNSSVYAEFGLYPGYCGENLARGGLDGVFDGWVASSGHKANILNGNYKQTAIVCGYANGRRYWVQLFIG